MQPDEECAGAEACDIQESAEAGGGEGVADASSNGSPASASRHSAAEEASAASAEQVETTIVGGEGSRVQPHMTDPLGLLLALRMLAMFRGPRTVLSRAGAIMHLQSAMGSACGEALEPLASLTILAILVDIRRVWVVQPVVKAWAEQVQRSQNKLIRGRPMRLPERVGVEALDPIEQAYKIYYQSELKSHVVDQVRQAAGRAICAHGHSQPISGPRAGTPHSFSGNFQPEHASASSRSSSSRRPSALRIRTGDAASLDERGLDALQRWVRAATPPEGVARANAPSETQNGRNAGFSTEDDDAGNSVLEKFERERRRLEEQVRRTV